VTIEIEHANGSRVVAVVRPLDVVHDAQRHAQDVADAEREGSGMCSRQLRVAKIGDMSLLAAREHLLRDLAAGLELRGGNGDLAAPAREGELEVPGVIGEHDEAALRAGDFNRRVDDEGQHVVEKARAAQRM
jgi:hypothetical protein